MEECMTLHELLQFSNCYAPSDVIELTIEDENGDIIYDFELRFLATSESGPELTIVLPAK